MAPKETKFRLSRIVVSAAVFISLCAVTSSAELRRCYWCGPLAEQVHRSQRALPCSGPNLQVTLCDPGYPYCAVVATSPPYIESRYCVKLYQDECYSLYCNSTKTWRMTCPCRGDLCNGPNTDREEDAFAGLTKIVAKTHTMRNKRALIAKSGFINMNRKNRIDNITIEENKNMINNSISNNEEVVGKDHENPVNEGNTTADVETKMDSQSDTSIVPDVNQADENITPKDIEPKSSDGTTNSQDFAAEVTKIVDNEMKQPSIQIDIPSANIESSDLKTEIILMSSEATKLMNDNKPSDATTNINENIANIQSTTEIMLTTIESNTAAETTTEAMKHSPAEVNMNENKMKPNEQLPTAEALQHNDTPTIKTTEQSTISTTFNSIEHIDITTQPSKTRNNTAVRMESHILTLAIGVILHYNI